MSWSKNSNCDTHRTIEEIVCDTVLYFRNRGHKSDVAIEQAALELGLSKRKARSIFYTEPVAFLEAEYQALRKAFLEHLDQRADDLARQAEQARMKRRQIELDL